MTGPEARVVKEAYKIQRLVEANKKAQRQLWYDFQEFYRTVKREFKREGLVMAWCGNEQVRLEGRHQNYRNNSVVNEDISAYLRFVYGSYYGVTSEKGQAYAVVRLRYRDGYAEFAVHKDDWEFLPKIFWKFVHGEWAVETVEMQQSSGPEPTYNPDSGWVRYRKLKTRLLSSPHWNSHRMAMYLYPDAPVVVIDRRDKEISWRGGFMK